MLLSACRMVPWPIRSALQIASTPAFNATCSSKLAGLLTSNRVFNFGSIALQRSISWMPLPGSNWSWQISSCGWWRCTKTNASFSALQSPLSKTSSPALKLWPNNWCISPRHNTTVWPASCLRITLWRCCSCASWGHCCRMNQSRDRSRAFHSIWKSSV